MNYISITALIKDGGDKQLQITSEMLGELALSIKKNGSEVVQLKDGSIVVAGILIISGFIFILLHILLSFTPMQEILIFLSITSKFLNNIFLSLISSGSINNEYETPC